MSDSKPILRKGNDTWQNARRGVWVCPFCGFNPPSDDWDLWEKHATKLILYPRIWKRWCVAIFAECPKCFEESWLHYRASMFSWTYEEFPKNWHDAIKRLATNPTWLEDHGPEEVA